MRSSGSPDSSPSMMVREWQVAIQVMKGPTSSVEGSSTTPQNLKETRIIIRGTSLGSPSATTYGLVIQNYGEKDSHQPADFVFNVLDVWQSTSLHFCFGYIIIWCIVSNPGLIYMDPLYHLTYVDSKPWFMMMVLCMVYHKSSKQFGQFTLSICKHCQSIHVFHFYLCFIINYASCMKTLLIAMYCFNINNLCNSICTLHVCVSLIMQA